MLAIIERLLPEGASLLDIAPLHGDGSTRRFYRVTTDRGSFVLLEGPDPEENAAYVRIARHLEERGVPVPRVCGANAARGLILLEDLGDRSLFAAICEGGVPPEELYLPVLDLLTRMQVKGAEGFEGVGLAAPYGPELMVEGEALYFAREFAAGLFGLEVPPGFRADAELLARLACRLPGRFFLHRDFQSRNIHLTPRGPVVIDFQGARFGPLAYDAAALILDPYAGLSGETRSRLLSAYRERLSRSGVDPRAFDEGWYPLGAFRLLQALGAFGKLGGRLKRPGFLEHAGKALKLLHEHMGEEGRREFPSLWELTERARSEWGRLGPVS
jgi:aminoglycoside/choline kinase family phosphotransferase